MLFPPEKRGLPKSAVWRTYARFPAKKRWHSCAPPFGLPWYSPPPPPESVRTDGRTLARSYGDVITKFSRLDGLTKNFHGAPLARFAGCSSSISSNMGAMLRAVVVVLGRTRPWSMPLAMLTMKKEMQGFLFLCMHVVLFLWLRCATWRPERSSAKICFYIFALIAFNKGKHA
jgi:hypothetical protein